MIIRTEKALPPRREFDHYATNVSCVTGCLALTSGRPVSLILDPAAGDDARWGAWAKKLFFPEAHVTALEIRDVAPSTEVDRFEGATDYLSWSPPADHPGFELICTNPPYRDLAPFLEKSFDLLAPGGRIVFLVRLAFLEGQKRARTLFRERPPKLVGVCAKRPSFQEDGKSHATAYCAVVWEQGYRGPTTLTWIL